MMNLGEKHGLDALLASWPAVAMGNPEGVPQTPPATPQDEEKNWDERADAIVKAALSNKASPGDLDALLAAPALAPEAGESTSLGGGDPHTPALLSGEKKMTEEKDPGTPAPAETPVPPAIAASAGETPLPQGTRKRTSLKEIAARASQAGASRPSSPGPAPGGASSSVAPPRPSVPNPLPRPVEAAKDDSGVINLDAVRAAATPQQVADAEKAKPAQADLFQDDHTVESAVDPAQKPAPAKAPVIAIVAAKKSNAGPFAGVAIAVLGIAAAVAIVARKPPAKAPQASVDTRPAVVATVAAAPTATPSAEATSVASVEPTPGATAEPDGVKPAEPARAFAGGPAGPAPATTGGAAPKDTPADGKLAAKAPTSDKPGDLQDEMARAVGAKESGGDKGTPAGPAPEPANGRNQTIPEQPSQGSVQAAVLAVVGGAKACVAGADDISRAQVTFSSNGTVSSVSVTGWAAAHGKSACVQAALKGAKVGPFSKPSYTVGVPIRP